MKQLTSSLGLFRIIALHSLLMLGAGCQVDSPYIPSSWIDVNDGPNLCPGRPSDVNCPPGQVLVDHPRCPLTTCQTVECRVDDDCPNSAFCDDGLCEVEVCSCPQVWAPVCGQNGETYGNECEASCAGVDDFDTGPCEQIPCVCPDLWSPVCAIGGRTFANECEVQCAGIEHWREGECDNDPIPCDEILDPVCGENGLTYDNACLADEVGVAVALNGPCSRPFVCPEIYEPVCGTDQRTYANFVMLSRLVLRSPREVNAHGLRYAQNDMHLCVCRWCDVWKSMPCQQCQCCDCRSRRM